MCYYFILSFSASKRSKTVPIGLYMTDGTNILIAIRKYFEMNEISNDKLPVGKANALAELYDVKTNIPCN